MKINPEFRIAAQSLASPAVAQVCNLPYRRVALCVPAERGNNASSQSGSQRDHSFGLTALGAGSPSGLKIRDTADYKSALPGQAEKAFSLVEILVAVSLLSFIVLGLLMMFNQTQRAFRMGMAQTDVLEAGRIFTDMISREMEQMAPSNYEPLPENGFANERNFWAVPSWTIRTPMLQSLPGSTALRTNVVQQFFFLTRQNQDWIGTGYTLLTNASGTDVGTLFRFTATKRVPFYGAQDLSQAFQNALTLAAAQYRTNGRVTTMSRVADGIVHLRVTPFAIDGRPLLPFLQSNLVVRLPNGNIGLVDGTQWTVPNQLPQLPEFAGYYFMGRAVPASVELEVGVLEQNVLGRYRSLAGNEASQRNYLSNRVGNVHIFRQRVPIRNVDFSVYP